MKLIFLLGNIGAEYRGTRHNIAWDVFRDSELAWTEQSKFRAYVAGRGSGDQKALFVRPTTYYNEAGQTLRALMDFYKIDTSDVLIIHDDLMLPFGTIRSRVGGRDAGNNGLKSIAQHTGADFARIRIGIASEQRQRMGDTAFVLGKFTKAEQEHLSGIANHVQSLVDNFLDNRFEATTYKLP